MDILFYCSRASCALCSPPTALCIDGVHGGKVVADDPLCSLHDPLQRLPLSLCGVAITHCDATGEDAFHESSVGHGEGLTTQSSLFQQPDKVQPLQGPFDGFHCVFSSAEAFCDVKA